MLAGITDSKEMSFVDIGEAYPDKYILVKIVELDHSRGKETGLALYLSDDRYDLVEKAKTEGMLEETIVLSGEDLLPVFGGLL